MKYRVPFVDAPKHYRLLKKDILAAVDDVLSRGDLIMRKDMEDFEHNLASFTKTRYAIGLNSGTDALCFSLKALNIGQIDEVITVSHTFVASISSIVFTGAKPILVDVGEDFTMNMDELEDVITPKTKAIIPVHLNGHMCDMEKLMEIAKKHRLYVIEDAAQALGAKFKGKIAGSIGITGCFSFYPFKLLGAFGDAGAVVTNDETLAEKIRLLRDHGQKTKTELVCYGFNSRLDNLQAAILNVKFKHLIEWIQKRREIAEIYNNKLSNIPEIKLPPHSDNAFYDVYQNYVIKAKKRDELYESLKEKGVETLIKDPIPVHLQKGLGLSHFHLPYSEQLAREVISLPIYPELTLEQIEYVVECIYNFYKNS